VASVSATQIVITASANLLGSATKVLVYKQKTKMVPADAAAEELDTAISQVRPYLIYHTLSTASSTHLMQSQASLALPISLSFPLPLPLPPF
jgi:hypothetical protein